MNEQKERENWRELYGDCSKIVDVFNTEYFEFGFWTIFNKLEDFKLEKTFFIKIISTFIDSTVCKAITQISFRLFQLLQWIFKALNH